MITKRSNHMPMFTKMARMNDASSDVRTFLDQKSCGAIRLQVIIVQYAHQYGPVARLMNDEQFSSVAAVPGDEEFHDVGVADHVPVTSMILFIFSMVSIVIRCSNLNALRVMMRTFCTIAKPEKIAPATKYGGKIVVCQPGMMRDGEVETDDGVHGEHERRCESCHDQIRTFVMLPVTVGESPAQT
jgi:hypothetical protein